MARHLWRLALVALLVLDPIRVAVREVSLHCDQDTSLPIVLLELEPHPEEAGADGQLPPSYRRPWAVPVRVFLGLAFCAAMLGPAAVVWLSARRNRLARRVLAALAVLTLALPLLGHVLGGERARELVVWSFLAGTGSLWYLAAAVVIWIDRRRGRLDPGVG